MRETLKAEGFEFTDLASFGEAEEAKVARIDAASISAAGKAVAKGAEAVFLSCTNLRTFDLIRDLEENGGELMVKLADDTMFELGRNVATTEGGVVFRNHMMELIQFSPSTDEVHEIPLVIFPPWISSIM